MSDPQTYLDVLARLPAAAPTGLDDLLSGSGHPAQGHLLPGGRFIPSPVLWETDAPRVSRIGLRVTRPPADLRRIAARLAAIALERAVYPVVISHVGVCGLQQYGFRVEQVAGTEEEDRRCSEEQIRRLWNLAIIVDAQELTGFG